MSNFDIDIRDENGVGGKNENNLQQQANLIPTLANIGIDLNEIFEFLDEVREHGHTNMYGAPQILVDEFEIPRRLSREIVSAWISDDRH